MDFGKGFYVTTDKKQAEMWANRKAKKAGNKQGVVMVSKVDDVLLDDYDGLSFNGVSDEWKTFVYNYRNGGQHHKYDFVTGPMLANRFTKIMVDLCLETIMRGRVSIIGT